MNEPITTNVNSDIINELLREYKASKESDDSIASLAHERLSRAKDPEGLEDNDIKTEIELQNQFENAASAEQAFLAQTKHVIKANLNGEDPNATINPDLMDEITERIENGGLELDDPQLEQSVLQAHSIVESDPGYFGLKDGAWIGTDYEATEDATPVENTPKVDLDLGM